MRAIERIKPKRISSGEQQGNDEFLRRLRALPKEEQDIVQDLFAELATSRDPEASEAALSAILEIVLDRRDVTAVPVDLEAKAPVRPWVVSVGKEIRRCRVKAKLTQGELAEATGIGQSHISRIERGRHSPSYRTLEKLAEALSVPVSTFDPMD